MRRRAGHGDKKFFRRTASKSKDINLGVRVFRGGIRL